VLGTGQAMKPVFVISQVGEGGKYRGLWARPAISGVLFSLACFMPLESSLADVTSDSTVSLTVSELVRITSLSDMTLTFTGGTSAPSDFKNVCVYTNMTSAAYKVTAFGNGNSTGGTGTDFFVHAGTYAIPYRVKWNTVTGGGGTELTAGSELTGLSGANTTSQSCGGSPNASFEVSFVREEILKKPSGTYSGVLTFAIEPGT